MDDQQGNVFDGTARSREWRRRRSNARSAADAGEPRSEAPKSIAGSLMVPAHMLDGTLPADQPATRNQQAALQRGTTTAVDGASSAERARRNPFLVPPADTAESRSKPDRWRAISGLLARSFAWIRTQPGTAPLWRPRTVARHLTGAPRFVRRLALAAFAAAIPITILIASQSGTHHPFSEPKVRAAGLLGLPGTDALSASSNPLAQRAAPHDRATHHLRRIHPRRTTRAHRRPHPPGKPVVVAARYTPSTSSTASYTPSSTSSSYASSGSTPVSSQSTGGATTSSSSSGGSRPAFGEHGILGPGRGAANTQ